MPSRRRLAFLASPLLAFHATAAEACPSCPLGERVRCEVLGPGFFENVAIATLPFLVIGMLTVWAHRHA